MSWFDTLLWPIKVVVAWIMVAFHSLAEPLGIDPESGAAWALSIVGLVIVIRILLIPLFVRQIKASRAMQMLSPELQAIQKKYKGKTDPASREAMSRETMALYSKHGTNPFSSCLPILAQSPIFFALFRVLYNMPALAAGTYPSADNPKTSIGPLTQQLADQATNATLFGAPISSYFLEANATAATRTVTVVLIILMSATTFTTQRQLTQKNMPASALQGPMAQQQKVLLYVLPLVFAVSGVNFPIGVLIYWTTTNIWSMGQQFYVIRRNPTPGSEAERQLLARRARKAAAKGIVLEEEKPAIEEKPRGQRQQPKRKDRGRPATRPTDSGAGGDETPPAADRPTTEGTTTPRTPRKRPSASGAAAAGTSTSGRSSAPATSGPGIESGSTGGRAPRRRPSGAAESGASGAKGSGSAAGSGAKGSGSAAGSGAKGSGSAAGSGSGAGRKPRSASPRAADGGKPRSTPRTVATGESGDETSAAKPRTARAGDGGARTAKPRTARAGDSGASTAKPRKAPRSKPEDGTPAPDETTD